MRRATKTLGIVTVIALLLISGIGAGAYTSFTADRDANMNVVTDSSGIIQLTPGPSKFVYKSGGELKIDVTNGGASGVNVNSTLKIGDSASLDTTNAFNVTNNDNASHDLTFSYTATSDSESTDSNVKFKIYNESGSHLKTATEGTDATITGAPAGEKYIVIIAVDTRGMTTNDDLSGTLSITSN